MKVTRTIAAAALVAGLALPAAAVGDGHAMAPPATPTTLAPASASAVPSVHRFRGRVTRVDRAHHWFGVRGGGRSVRIHTTRGTAWHGCGWGDMHRGDRIQVLAQRRHGAWIARTIEGHHAGDHGGRHE